MHKDLGLKADRPNLAVVLMLCALSMLSFQDALLKWSSVSTSLWQIQLVRAGFSLTLLLAFLLITRRTTRVPILSLPAIIVRSLLHLTAMLFFFASMPFLKLSQMAAGLYMFPLFVAVFSALFFGEKVGPRRIFAILVGFSGALLVLRPLSEEISTAAFLPICAAIAYSGAILSTRNFCRNESPLTIAYAVQLAYFIAGLVGVAFFSIFDMQSAFSINAPFLLGGWLEIDSFMISILCVAGLLNLVSAVALSRAYQSAESSWLVPFDYSYLIFASFWGYIFWREVADITTVLGMMMIAGSGAFVAWRERVQAQRQAAQ